MQPALRDTCTMQADHERPSDERIDMTSQAANGVRRWINDALDWLDNHWDDPELRSGFWNSGW